jgi:hypothetical protein
MERIVVVGIVPVDRARRDVALLVQLDHFLQRLDHPFLDLRVLGMQLAVGSDDIQPAISDQEILTRSSNM